MELILITQDGFNVILKNKLVIGRLTVLMKVINLVVNLFNAQKVTLNAKMGK